MEQFVFAPNGIAPDLVQESAPATVWTKATNCVVREGMERAGGVRTVFGTPSHAPRWLLNTSSIGAASFWVYGADAGIGGTDGGAAVDLTPTTGFTVDAAANVWTGGNLNGVPVVCNGRAPWWWAANPTNPFVALPGWPAAARCKAIRPYKYHLIALNVDSGTGSFNPDLLWWSSAAVPGAVPSSWTPAPANEAGSAQLSATTGPIIDGFALRDAFIVYKANSCYRMQYVGGANVMDVKPLFTDVGLLARNCVAAIGEYHVVLVDGDVILHDGNSAVSIAEGWVRDTLFSSVNAAAVGSSFVIGHTPTNEAWIVFAGIGATRPDRALVYDLTRKKWGERELGAVKPWHIAQGSVPVPLPAARTWAGQTGSWAAAAGRTWNENAAADTGSRYELVAAGINGAAPGTFVYDQSADTLGQITRGELERDALDFGDPNTVKTVSRVWIKAKAPFGTVLGVQIAGTMAAGAAPEFGPVAYVTIGLNMSAPLFATGRYISLRVFDASIVALTPWKLAQATFEYAARGQF